MKLNGKIPEQRWKEMRFFALSLMHLLGKYEEDYAVCSSFLKKMRKNLRVLNSIPHFEWKMDFHFRIKTEELKKRTKQKSAEHGMIKKDFMKLRYLWLQLLFLVRGCSEKSYERTFAPRSDLSTVRKKLVKICDQLLEGLGSLDSILYKEDGKEYNFVLEIIYARKPRWKVKYDK